MNWQRRVYLGTWQFSGDFNPISEQEIESLISCAVGHGVMRFDTAAAYGNGNVELILGKVLPNDAVIVTKVPALKKPAFLTTDRICGYYPSGLIKKSVKESLARLNRRIVDTVLLHNWVPAWNVDNGDILEVLDDLKKLGLAKKVGISLSDGFRSDLPVALVRRLDVIEAPYNLKDYWVLRNMAVLKKEGKEILLRSLFIQGLLVRNEKERQQFVFSDCRVKKVEGVSGIEKQNSYVLLRQAWELGTSVVLGMTTKDQIRENIEFFKGG